MTKERHIYIRPPEKPSSTTMSSPALINLAVALGEYKAISGIEFDVIQHDRFHLRVTYWQDEAFTALRLKFGHWFVTEEQATRVTPPQPVKPPTISEKVRQEARDMIYRLNRSEDQRKSRRPDRAGEIIQQIRQREREDNARRQRDHEATRKLLDKLFGK